MWTYSEAPVATLAAAAVAMEYCDPANEVSLPAPSVARVIASPPADVMTVIA